MSAPGEPFPRLKLPSSKGGVTNLGDALDKGPVIAGVLTAAGREAWLDVVADRCLDWLMYQFANVYVILRATPAEARELADTYGIQAPLLCAGDEPLPEPGFYRIDGGVVTARVGLDQPVEALDRLNRS